jgi:hypothetical protein
MQWVPLITFVQIMVDAMNAMRTVPGHFKSFGHDYQADTAPFVHAAYHLAPVTDDQMSAVVDTLMQLQQERSTRIVTTAEDAKKAGDAKQRTTKGKRPWIRHADIVDLDEAAIEAPAEFQ